MNRRYGAGCRSCYSMCECLNVPCLKLFLLGARVKWRWLLFFPKIACILLDLAGCSVTSKEKAVS